MDRRRASLLALLALAVFAALGGARLPAPSRTAIAAGVSISATVSPLTPAAGTPATVSLRLVADAPLAVDAQLEVLGPRGAITFIRSWKGQALAARSPLTLSGEWSIPAGSLTGVHTVRVNLFAADTGQLVAAVQQAAAFSVAAATVDGGGRASEPVASPQATATAAAAATLPVYADALAGGWASWSWGSTVNFASTAPVHSGSSAITFTVTQPWGGLYLHSNTLVNTTPYQTLRFMARASQSGQKYGVALYNSSNARIGTPLDLAGFGGDPVAGAWKEYRIPLTALGASGALISGFTVTDLRGMVQPMLYIDAVALEATATATTPTPTPSPSATPSPTSTPVASVTPQPVVTATPESALTVFGDALAAGWADRSWDSAVNLAARTSFSGRFAISHQVTAAWGGLYLRAGAPVSTAGYTELRLALRATQSGQSYGVQLRDEAGRGIGAVRSLAEFGGQPPRNTWKEYRIPLSTLAPAGAWIMGITLQDMAGQAQPVVFVDAVQLLAATGAVTPAPTVSPTPAPTSTPTPSPTPAATSTPTPAPTSTPTPTPTPGGAFVTLVPGSALPSGASCATRVRRSSWEPRPGNAAANATTGGTVTSIDRVSAAAAFAARIDGNFTGTTDEILQWASCKWGFDEDLTRAQAAAESWWRQSETGDVVSDPSLCPAGYGAPCPTSFGILQIKWTAHIGTFPMSRNGTPFNADYALAWRRACYEGAFTWLHSVSGNGATYQAGDVWGCVGLWYSGRWYDAGASTYIAKVKDYLERRVWLESGF